MKAEGQLRAAEGAQDFTAQLKLKNKIEAINDRFTRLSIWPLIKAGEFGSISHSDMSKDDQMLTGGRLHDYVDKQISKLPKAVQNAGDLALIGKDTALFQVLRSLSSMETSSAKRSNTITMSTRKASQRNKLGPDH